MIGRGTITLWEETLEALRKRGVKWDDIRCVFIDNKRMRKEDFERCAKQIRYAPWAFGFNTVSQKLRLFGTGFMFVRWEYDGSEGWEFLATEPPEEYTLTSDKHDLLEP